jgi:transcription antitermination factor NusA-like protein
MTKKSDQGQCCKRNLKRMAIQEEMTGTIRMHHWNKEPRLKRAIMSWKQKNTQQDQKDGRAGDHKANSRDLHQTVENECQDIVEGSATS